MYNRLAASKRETLETPVIVIFHRQACIQTKHLDLRTNYDKQTYIEYVCVCMYFFMLYCVQWPINALVWEIQEVCVCSALDRLFSDKDKWNAKKSLKSIARLEN